MESFVWRRALGAAGVLGFAASLAACSPAANSPLAAGTAATATGNVVASVPSSPASPSAPQANAASPADASAVNNGAGAPGSGETKIAGNFTAPKFAPVPEPRPQFPGEVKLAIKTDPAAATPDNGADKPPVSQAPRQVAQLSADKVPADKTPADKAAADKTPAAAPSAGNGSAAGAPAGQTQADAPAGKRPSRAQQQAALRRMLAYSPAVMESGGVTTTGQAVRSRRARHIRVASLDSGIGIGSSEPGASAERTPVAVTNRPLVHHDARARGWSAAYPHVVTGCFGPDLRRALNAISRRFGQEVKVTSGHRNRGRRRSMHRFCRAADIRVPGVRPSVVARFARSLPYVGGVGTYRRKSIVHIDTRSNRMVWRY